jgi:hypothetical protein
MRRGRKCRGEQPDTPRRSPARGGGGRGGRTKRVSSLEVVRGGMTIAGNFMQAEEKDGCHYTGSRAPENRNTLKPVKGIVPPGRQWWRGAQS